MDLFSYLLGKKAGSKGATKVVANPELAGTEDNLTGLQVGDEKYKVSEVNANPTLAGTEAELTGLQVDGTKYKVQNLDITWGTIISPISYDWTLTATHDYTKVPLEIARQKSNNFLIVNDEIVVNKDFSIVAVSLKIPVSAQSTSESRYILFEVVRNGTPLPDGGSMTESYCVGSKTTTVVVPMTMTSVKANDHIVVKIYGQNGDKIYRGNLQLNILGINE